MCDSPSLSRNSATTRGPLRTASCQFLQELWKGIFAYSSPVRTKEDRLPLAVSWSALPGFVGHEDYGSVVLRLPFLIGFHGRRQNSP